MKASLSILLGSLALATPAAAADLDYAPPPVVERERIYERRYVEPPPVVIRERVVVEEPVYYRRRFYPEPYGYYGPGWGHRAWGPRYGYGYHRGPWGHGYRGRW